MSLVDDEIEYYTQAIQADPNDADAYFGRGKALSIYQEYENALADFDMAIRINPTNAHYFLARASVYLIQQEHQKSIDDYTEAIRLAPDDIEVITEAYAKRATQYSGLEDFEAAISDYTTLMKLNPEDRYHYLKHRAYMQRANGNPQAAMDDLAEVIQSDPTECEAIAFRAFCKLELGDIDGADADYTEAIRLHPAYPAYFLLLRGNLRIANGNIEAGKNDHEEVIKLAPDSEGRMVYLQRSEAALKLKRFDEALRNIEILLEKEPNNYMLKVIRGDIFEGMGNLAAARQDYDFAIQALSDVIAEWKNPKPLQTDIVSYLYRNRGRAQAGKGNISAAIADYQQALLLIKGKRIRNEQGISEMEAYIQAHQDKTY